jgi:hypothetical protein
MNRRGAPERREEEGTEVMVCTFDRRTSIHSLE